MKDLIARVATYPMMAPGGLDYAEGHEYETKQIDEKDKNMIGVLHQIHGENLVSKLLKEGYAEFACTIVSPWCAYRHVEKASGTLEQSDGTIQIKQQLNMSSDDFMHPVMFQPFVMTNSEVIPFTAQKSHGLDQLWMGREVRLPVAAIVALQPFWNAKTVLQSILRMKKVSDENIAPGSFEVKAVGEQGFYFLVEVEESLFNGLRNPASFEHRNSIYSVALAQGLSILNEQYQEPEDWAEQQNLKLLYHMFRDRGIPTWDEENFRANQAAAAFHPHVVKQAQESE